MKSLEYALKDNVCVVNLENVVWFDIDLEHEQIVLTTTSNHTKTIPVGDILSCSDEDLSLKLELFFPEIYDIRGLND